MVGVFIMRFQQLNRDPNSIMRKKLVKSKKNWIVVSSLSFAGGLLLLGGPTEVVHAADTVTAPTEQVTTSTPSSDSKTGDTESVDVNKDAAPTTTEEKSDVTAQPDTTAPVEKETTIPEKVDTTSPDAAPESLDKDTVTSDVKSTETASETQPVDSTVEDIKDTQTPIEDVKNINDEKTVVPVSDPDVVTEESTDTTKTEVSQDDTTQSDTTQDDTLAANLTASKAQLTSLGVSAEDLDLTDALTDGNIAEGMQGTTPWTIDADGVLHLGTAGETTSLADNTATTTQHTSTGSSQIDSSSTETKESPTSPWMKHANDITRINFEGDVNAASDMSYMFADLNNLTTITNADKLHTVVSDDLSMTKAVGMFANDTNLKEISSNSTTNETKPTIDLSSWNLASVTDANSMFLNDSSIEYVTFPDSQESTLTSNTNFNYMFKNNTSLINAYMPQLQFRRTKSMIGMFQNDRSLTTLDISSWNMANSSSNIDTGDSSRGEGMFDGTDSLTSLKLSSINRFLSYTALSSKNGSSWTGGGKSLLSDPSKADNSTTFNLNSIVSNLGSGILNPTVFTTDGNVPADIEANLIIPSNLGDIETSISGPIYSSQDIKVPVKEGYTANVSNITANILGDKAVTNYYVTYTRNATTTTIQTSKGTQTIDIPAGAVGTTSDPITLPTVNGYDSPQVKVQYNKDGNVITDLDGNPISDTNEAKYTGSKVSLITPNVVTPIKNNDVFIVKDNENNTLNNDSDVHVDDQVSIIPPTVKGYTPSINGEAIPEGGIVGTIDTDGKFVPTDSNLDLSNIKYIGNEIKPKIPTISAPDDIHGSTTTDDNGNDISPDQTLHVGDTVIITIPAQDGYKALDKNNQEVKTVTGTINSEGEFVPNSGQTSLNDITYVGNEIISKIPTISTPDTEQDSTATDGNGNTINTDEKLHVGDTVIITLPSQDGYKALDKNNQEVKTVTGTINSEGEFIPNSNQTSLTDITYIGNEIIPTIPTISTPDKQGISTAKDSNSQLINADEKLHVGDTVTITLPSQDGYKAFNNDKEITTVDGTIDAKGNFVPNDSSIDLSNIKYIGNEITSNIDTISTPNGSKPTLTDDASGKTIENNTTVHVGDKVTISIPTQDGYHVVDKNGNTITTNESTGSIGADGKFIPGKNQVDPASISYVGDSKAADINNIETPNKTTGSTTVNGKVINNGDEVHVGDKVTLTIPAQDGYHIIDKNSDAVTATESTGTIGTDGKFVPDEGQVDPTDISYIGNEVTPNVDSILTPDKTPGTVTDENGNPLSENKDVHVGDKVIINLPTQNGYHPEDKDGKTIDSAKLTGTVGPNGEFVPDPNSVDPNDIKYVGNLNKPTTIQIKNPDGKITSLAIPAGHFGDDPVTVTAKKVSGYTAPSVIVSFGADGTPTIVNAKTPDKELSTSDVLSYIRIPSNHYKKEKKQTTDTPAPTPSRKKQNVATYSEKGQIHLYTLDDNNKMTAIRNRGLAKQSTWYSDEQITVDGVQYLRVANNEWVQARQVYPYQDLNQYVRTYDKTAKVIYKSEDEIINNRVLQPNSSWYSDRTTEVINGEKYYRVATNEFVSAKDAYIYQPTNMVVTTHKDSPSKDLYTAKGELITNRSLISDSNWVVDSIVYIKGIKYYRVATNEFVKASDVDINH